MKKYLLTGLVILLPVVLTALIIHFLFNFFTTPFVVPVKALLIFLHDQFGLTASPLVHIFFVRLIALILLVLFVLMLGAIARHIFLKHMVNKFHGFVARIPFVKGIYSMSRDVFSALLSTEGKKAFKAPVLIPFPTKPSLSIGFLAGEVAPECQRKAPTKLRSVFTPTAPHPISGFLLLVPESDIQQLSISNEEAVKFIVSCGMIIPESSKK